MGELLHLHGRALQEVEAIVERQSNLVDFDKNVRDLASLAQRTWRNYRGEQTSSVCFGSDGFNLAPSPCTVCGRIMGLAAPENAHIFWASSNGDQRVLCIDCNRRYWNDQNGLQPA